MVHFEGVTENGMWWLVTKSHSATLTKKVANTPTNNGHMIMISVHCTATQQISMES
jgi:hypothetical protein